MLSRSPLIRRKPLPRTGFAALRPKRLPGTNRTSTLKPKSDREKERKALDALLRPYVLQRAGGRCEKCGRIGGAQKSTGTELIRLQVAHFKSRRIEHTRWHPDNVACLCKGCHFLWSHSEPDEFHDWWLRTRGPRVLAALNLIWRTLRTRPRPDLTLVRLDIMHMHECMRAGRG